MNYFLPILAVLLVGCGHHESESAPKSPAPTPFADVAGNYLATVTATGGSYNTVSTVGDAQTVTITAEGIVTAGASVYALDRNPDGSFQIQRSLNATSFEVGFAPFNLSGVVIEWHQSYSIIGTVSYSLVKMTQG